MQHVGLCPERMWALPSVRLAGSAGSAQCWLAALPCWLAGSAQCWVCGWVTQCARALPSDELWKQPLEKTQVLWPSVVVVVGVVAGR